MAGESACPASASRSEAWSRVYCSASAIRSAVSFDGRNDSGWDSSFEYWKRVMPAAR